MGLQWDVRRKIRNWMVARGPECRASGKSVNLFDLSAVHATLAFLESKQHPPWLTDTSGDDLHRHTASTTQPAAHLS